MKLSRLPLPIAVLMAFRFSGPAPAATLYSNLQDTAIPLDFGGVFLDVDTGAMNAAEFAGWDINPFFGGTGVASSPAFQPARTGTGNTDTILQLTVGATVDVSRLFSTGYGGSQTHLGTQFTDGQGGYLGFKFTKNNATGPFYGWMRVVFTGNTAGAVIKDWAFDDSGSSIVTGRVLQSAPSGNAQLVTLSPGASETFTLGSAIADTGGNTNSVLKTGTGTTTLSGNNSYTGATTIGAGTLRAGVANAFGSGSAVTVTAGATLDFNGFSQALGSLAGAGNVTLGSATLTVGSNASATFSGVLAGLGGLTKSGLGTATLSGANTYTGATMISAGTLSVASIGNGGVAGNLGAASNAAANLVFDGGTLQYTGATASTDRNFTISAGKSATFDITTNTLTLLGAALTSTGSLTKLGAGTLNLGGGTGARSYNFSSIVVGGGVLSVAALGDPIPGVDVSLDQIPGGIVASGGGTLDVGHNRASTGPLTLNGGAIVGLSNGVFICPSITATGGTISAAVSCTGALTKTGPGTLTLDLGSGTGARSYNFSSIVVSGGTLSVAGDPIPGVDVSLDQIPGGIIASGGARIDVGHNRVTTGPLTLDGASITGLSNGVFICPSITATGGTISAEVSCTGALTKTGPGTLTLSGPQNYPTLNTQGGRTDLSATLGTGTSTINANAEINITVSQTLAALNIADGVEVTFGDGLAFAGGPEKTGGFTVAFTPPSSGAGLGGSPVVPEPGSVGLLLAGVLGILGRRQRRV